MLSVEEGVSGRLDQAMLADDERTWGQDAWGPMPLLLGWLGLNMKFSITV